MNLKPFRDYSEHQVVNGMFTLGQTGSKGMPVTFNATGGWVNSGPVNGLTQNALPNNFAGVNAYSPRWSLTSVMRPCVVGEKPFGITLYDVLEVNQFNLSLLYDPVRKAELQAVVTGEAVPLLREGLLLVGPFGTGNAGLVAAAGRFAAVTGTGDWCVLANNTGVVNGITGAALPVFGQFLGGRDNDGYAAVWVSCK